MRLSDYLKQLRDAPYIKHTLKDDSYQTVAAVLEFEHPSGLKAGSGRTPGCIQPEQPMAILKRAHKKMVAAVESAWEGRADGLPYKDQNQFVTMASIIEKETAVASERDRWRRSLSTDCALACACK